MLPFQKLCLGKDKTNDLLIRKWYKDNFPWHIITKALMKKSQIFEYFEYEEIDD